MSSWRDAILNDFVPKASKLTLVSDPDSLLTEEKLALELLGRGFDLIEFNDPVEFRYACESKYRSLWDRGDHTDRVIILRLQDKELDCLPYDLLQTGRKLSFNLGGLFPGLSYSVVEELDLNLLDQLYEAQRNSSSDNMGDNATRDFILRYVFGIATDLITNEVELLRALLRLHYRKIQIPLTLISRLIQTIRKHSRFKGWPLDEIVPDGEAFFAFLQERWPIFLGSLDQSGMIRDTFQQDCKYPGPDRLPFDHQDIRVYIGNLFIEGKLAPIRGDGIRVKAGSWVHCGIVSADTDNQEIRADRLFDHVEATLPTAEFRHSDWISFALKWAELSCLVHCGSNATQQSRFRDIGDAMNSAFSRWLSDHYASLTNLPPTPPVMLHHVARCLARDIERSENNRVALIVMDGLALDQWVAVRQILKQQVDNLVMRESATFAWIPTLTSVSRQAIFAGRTPLYFPSSVHSTHREENLWKQFWEGHGLARKDIAYQRGLGDGDVSDLLDAVIHPGKTRAVGLVVDKVDKIMHGMQLGSVGMHSQIRLWCQGGFLGAAINYLLNHGYRVWLTADHGNIECHGKGRPSEGAIAETRGERVRVYPTPELRSQIACSFPFAHEWQPVGLPPDYFPLVAGGRDAFAKPGDSIVGHGGISIEEVIVPLVKFERTTQ